ncbi:MAG: fibronectin type III domain-containing protein, partial [Thermoleophilia bacterium]|nr:fibronectin type III domain-containing protein [Thermoleophilia bacterium]
EAWRYAGSWSRLGTASDSTYGAAGWVGVGLRGTSGRLDDFGARTSGAVATSPDAPTNLQAAAGNASVSLSWNAPAFDGGSPVSAYRVYRGTSPNPTTALTPDLGVVTSFLDTGLTNGTTYYYKVSALNANGESPASNEASATPSGLVLPDEPLPTLDDFNRANENPLSDSGKWSNAVNGGVETGLNVNSNTLACAVSSTCTAWRNNAQYGPESEVWSRISTLPGNGNAIRLYARVQAPGTSGYDGYMLLYSQLSGTDQVVLFRITNSSLAAVLTVNQEFAAGDRLLLRATGSTLEAWRYAGSWSRLGTASDSTYGAAGWVGVGLRGTSGRLDDFGARTSGAVATSPDAPTNLQAAAGNASVSLSWNAPAFDGGSPITGYSVYRGTSAGTETFLANTGNTATTYTDSTAANGTTYYYKVSALNLPGEGGLSNEASATPVDLVLPVEPLPTLDNFDRANETPVSFGGRWGDGILGSGERSLKVVSNQLASTRSTTATAWWNNAQYGADCESWATIATLPGNGNAVRLYVRLQTPGTSAVDGYMLFYNQLSGTDQVVLLRITNGALTALSTVNREITAGSRLLLRATGTALESWVQDGAGWSQLGRVTDSTYVGAGYVGVGIRGKTGRLDDFGAR